MNPRLQEALILAGGLGTRLSNVLEDIPKVMAPVREKPFLEYVLAYLEYKKFRRIILSVGYRHEVIRKHFGKRFGKLNLDYAIEPEPLGTGGALMFALGQVNQEHFLLLNGDSLFLADPQALLELHLRKNARISLALKSMEDSDRYGSVVLDNERITGFSEKVFSKKALINGGFYVASEDIFRDTALTGKFSLEKDYLERYCQDHLICGRQDPGYFIDIGIPEDYRKAQQELPEKLNSCLY